MGFRAEAQWAPTTSSTSASITREGSVFLGWSTVPNFGYLSSTNHILALESGKSFLFSGSAGYATISGSTSSILDGNISHYIFTSSNGLIGGYKYVYDNNLTTYKRSFQFDGGASEITTVDASASSGAALRIRGGKVTSGTGGSLTLTGGQGSSGYNGGEVIISGGANSSGTNAKVIIGQKGTTEIGGSGGTIDIKSAQLKVNGIGGSVGSALGTNSSGAPVWLDVPDFTAPIDPGFVPKKMSLLSGNAFEQSQIFEDETSLNVGIGTSTPATKISIHGNGSIGTGYSSIAAPANGLIVEGRLGIGSSAPLGHLQIRSNLTFRDDAVSSEIGRNWYYNGTTQTKIFDEPLDVTHGSGKMQIGSDGRFNFYNASMDQALTSVEANTPKLTILNSGKIGIGTTNPRAQLEVVNDIKITQRSGMPRAKLIVGNFKPDDAIWQYDDIALAADGHIFCKELIVLNTTSWITWPDYVFSKDYKLASLDSVEKFVHKHNHLPEIPSQTEVRQKGVALEEMNQALLKKVEELTLYVIQLNKEVQTLKSGK